MTELPHVVSEVTTITAPTFTQPLSTEHSSVHRRWNKEENRASVPEKCCKNKARLCARGWRGVATFPTKERQSCPKITKLRGTKLFPLKMASLFAV